MNFSESLLISKIRLEHLLTCVLQRCSVEMLVKSVTQKECPAPKWRILPPNAGFNSKINVNIKIRDSCMRDSMLYL